MKNVQNLSLKTQIHATTESYEMEKREQERKLQKLGRTCVCKLL